MRVVVPFAVETPKTRLADVLDADERRAFARAMLDDVVAGLRDAGHEPEILATAAFETDLSVTVDERPLTPAVNAFLDTVEPPVGIVMSDLPLLTVEAVDRLVTPSADVVIAPGRGGGTNALVVRDAAFRVDYHGCSFRDHLAAARRLDGDPAVVDSHRLATDVDEPADLLEVVLHSEGEASAWLADAGFSITAEADRPTLER